jgi:RNA polymerase sigma-70 factor (ECF subfamily)
MRFVRSVPRPNDDQDSAAFKRVAAGEIGALGDVYDRHARSLLEFVARAVGREEGEDVVHTVFVRAARLAPTYDGRSSSARAWLYGIAVRVLQERRRSLGRAFRAFMRLHSDEPRSTVPTVDHRADVERALRILSEAKRVVLLLVDLEGFTCAEVAVMLGIPVGTVWTRLYHARREMRDFYEGKA